jgi:hypothetical protein
MQARLLEYLYWAVILLWIAANAAWLVTAKRPRLDRISVVIWVLVLYSLWRRWRRTQGGFSADDTGA